jgi:hypothetical protein
VKSPISSVLSDTETAVVQTIVFRMTTIESLHYLKQHGLNIGRSTFFRVKKKLEENKLQRLVALRNRFTEHHLERIDKLELIESLMWKYHEQEKTPTGKVRILESIVRMQPFLSAYYDSTISIIRGVEHGTIDQDKQNRILELTANGEDNKDRFTLTEEERQWND